MTDYEDVLEKIVEFFESSELNAIITAINAEKADSITLEYIEKVYFGERFIDLIAKAGGAVIMVTPGRSDPRETELDFSADDYRPEITVIFRQADGKAAEATRKGLRYARAMKQLLNQNPSLGLKQFGEVKNTEFVGVDYTRIAQKGIEIFYGVTLTFKIFMVDIF